MLRAVLLHNTASMSSRLIFAFALSLALHGGLLLPDALQRLTVAPPPAVLQATLRLPPKPEAEPPLAEPLLKNTLDREEKPPVVKPPSPPRPPEKPAVKARPSVKSETKRVVRIAQRKLSEYVFYPEAARQRGIEGTVGLLIILAADGAVEDVRIVASSGYPILDNAAAKGAWAIQKLPGATARELPLDYTFRLIP